MDALHGKLLVVDDNEMNRDMLSRRLERKGHTVVQAEDGKVALECIEKQSFDVILLDIMMPGIDGIEVLKSIRESQSVTELPVIMVTARDDTVDIVKALKLGASDYITKPLDFPVVLARVQTQLSLKRAHDALETANQRMRQDLEAAARVQRTLLPGKLPKKQGVQFAWRSRPCDELGGDSLNIFTIDDHHIGIFILDVSGHGVPAALLAVTVTHTLSFNVHQFSVLTDPSEDPSGYSIIDPARVAKRLNRLYPMDPKTLHYFVILYGILNTEINRFRFVSAGMPGPILLQRGEPTEIQDFPCVPIGLLEDSTYEEQVIDLKAGDRLFLHSDGIYEERDPSGEQFGRERMRTAIENTRSMSLQASIDALINETVMWKGTENLSDDISIVAFEITDNN